MVKRWLPSVATLSSLSMALVLMAPADAVELGNVSLQSSSGQPLAATVQLSDINGLSASDIRVQVASAADFERFSLERIAALDTLQIQVDLSGATPVLRLSSPVTINEPFISLVLDTRWPSGRVLTEYTLRLESPAFSAGSAPASVAPVRSVQEPVTDIADAQDPVPSTAVAPPSVVSNTVGNTAAGSQNAGASASSSSPSSAGSSPAIVSNASTITVNAGDTMWELAQRVRPDSSVTVQQTMLALQRLNPQAFIGDNINRVRRGEILQVPELSEIRRITSAEAVAEVSRQNRQLAAGAATPAQPVTAAPSAASAGAGTQGELRVVTVDEEADNQQPDASAAGNQSSQRSQQLDALEDRIALREEDLARQDSENSELNARLAMLQQQIASAQEIIRLRDLELAQLQQRLAEENGAASAADSPPPVITMAPDAGPLQRLMHLLTSNTWAMLGAAAILVLLLVLLMVRRNRAAVESKAQASARENDGISLGEDADELLFSGVAEAAAESAAESAARSSVLYAGLDTEQDPDLAAQQDEKLEEQLSESDQTTDPAADLAAESTDEINETDEIDDWQPAELASDTDEFEAADLDERFELDETSLDREQDRLSLDDANLEDSTLSGEDTGADLDWPDQEEKHSLSGDEFDISLTEEDELLAARQPASVDPVPSQSTLTQAAPSQTIPLTAVPPVLQAEKPTVSAVDDVDDLAFLPAEDDFTGQFDPEDDDEDFDFLSDSDEAATKLDLARAYIDMGDSHGAREILEEVLSEGTEEQRKEAQELLGRF